MPKKPQLEIHTQANGFTLVEILVVIGVMAILFTASSVNLTRLIPDAQLKSSSEILLAELKQQQIKAMLGDTEGRVSRSPYGIHFSPTSYTLFFGSSYNPAESSNIVVDLEGTQLENISFPGSVIVFELGSGEVQGLAAGTYSFTVRDTITNKQELITINKYGGLTQN